MSEAGKRFGTEAALNWMRVRAKALTKRRQQGAGLVEVLPEQEEQVSDDESGCMGPDASIEASFMALQDFQVGQGGPLSDMERKQVWWILRRRQREKQQQEETGKVDVPVEGAEAKEEPGSTWISSQDQEDFETIEEDDELTMLVHFLQTNRGLQKLPPAQIQWLAARLEPEVVPQEVLHDSEKEKHDKVVGKAALAFLKKGDTKERLLVHSDSPRSTDHATSFSARLLQQAREMSAVNSSEQKSKAAKLRILVHGDAQWKGSGSLRPGDIMVDLPSFMPSWYRWEPENKDPLACSELLVASTPIDDEFVARLGSPFQCAAERAAAFHAASKLPGMRSMSDLAMISHYLRRMPMFALSQDSLEAVAYALQVRVLQKNEVLAWEGQTPAEILIPLSVVITAWRSLPEGAAPSAHKRIRADAILSARSALEAPQVMRTASRRSQGLHSSGLEARAAPQTCVDVILKDHHVRHSEWALAAGYKCSVSLVSLSNGKAFCVSKNEYQRHVQQHRSQNAPLEVTAFLAGSIPQEHLSATDLNWLEETPLARCACLRVLPRVVRKHILGSGRLQRLPAQNWLCREEETLDSCFMLIHGKLELKLPNQSAQEEEATRILQPGAVIGDSVFAFGQSDASWAHHYRAAGEECLLYEVPRPAFQAAIKQLPKVFQDPKAAEMEEALQMPSSARSFQQLQLLSSVLEKQEPYNTVDAFARIELCQNVSFRHLSCGDDLEMSSQCSCQILRGEASIRLKGEMQVEVIRIPSGAFIGEEVGMSGDFLLHAMEDTRLFWLDKSQLPQGKGAVVHHAGEKALDKASADRNRAIQTLKFKAPEQRSLEDVALLVKLLQNNKFFNEQEESLLKEICRGMSYTEFSRHSVIIKQGDIADVCYVLLKGTAGVWVDSTKPKEDDENPTEIPDGNDLQLLSPTSLNSPRTIKSPAEVPETPTSAVKRLKQAAMKLLAVKGGAGTKEIGFVKEKGLEGPVHNLTSPQAGDLPQATGGPMNATQVKVMKVGACFGEAGLLHGALRNASIVASEHCQLGAISKSLFEAELRAAYLAREQKRANFLREHLPKTSVGGDHAQILGGFFSEHQAHRGKVLCTAGKPCDRLMIIRDGLCKVRSRQDGLMQDVGEIGKGQFVGLSTVGAIETEPFTIVCASSEVGLLRMDAADVRTRVPADLKEAISSVGTQMFSRMQRRADFLKEALMTSLGELELQGLPEPAKPSSRLPRARTPRDSGGEVNEAHRRQLQRLMEKQQREWEDLATTAATQWSPTLFADKQKEKDRLIRQLHSRDTKTHRLLRENATWQHEKHLTLTRPELREKVSCRKISGEIRAGLFFPGAVQKRGMQQMHRLDAVWLPSSPYSEVLKPSRVGASLARAPSPSPVLQRVMAVPLSPSLRSPHLCVDEADEDAVLCCMPFPAEGAKNETFEVEPVLEDCDATPAKACRGKERLSAVGVSNGHAPPARSKQGEADNRPFFVLHEKQYSCETLQQEAMLPFRSRAAPLAESQVTQISDDTAKVPLDVTLKPTPPVTRASSSHVSTEKRRKLLRCQRGRNAGPVQVPKQPARITAPDTVKGLEGLHKLYSEKTGTLGQEEIALLMLRQQEEEVWEQELNLTWRPSPQP